jgi:hypothetical protein
MIPLPFFTRSLSASHWGAWISSDSYLATPGLKPASVIILLSPLFSSSVPAICFRFPAT